MKKIFTLLSLILLWSFLGKSQQQTKLYNDPEEDEFQHQHPSPDHRTCGTMDSWEFEKQRDPEFENRMMKLEEEMQEWIRNNQENITIEGSKTVITIPVVVHVIYKTATQNISEAKILSQIAVLNKDYRKRNSDTTAMPAVFKPVFADIEIEFCMAQRDPNGLPTNGITRTSTTKSSFAIETNDAKYTAQGGHDAWNRNKYLNLWVVPSITSGGSPGILGYAQFPGGTAATDGVVIGYNYFGTLAPVDGTYNKGRTATHEIGHWLNLYHIWGDDGTACTGTDYCADTPNQADENYGCPNFATNTSCSNSGDMAMNYMDYTDDPCMYMFTLNQKTRMQAAMTTASRVGIKTSEGCTAVTLQTATPSGTNYCPGTTATITFTQTGVMNPGNIYTVQLSDSSGSFTSPVAIGTLTNQNPGAINVTYPNNAIPGIHYKIRVTSSNPVTTTTASTNYIIINAKPTSGLVSSNVCVNTPYTITATPGYVSYNWSTGSTINTTQVSSPTEGEVYYKVTITDNNCTTVDSVKIIYESCTGLNKTSEVPSKIICSPNPTSGNISISLNEIAEDVNLEIIDSKGLVVYSNKLDGNGKKELNFNFKDLSKGIYTIKVSTINEQIIQKVVFK